MAREVFGAAQHPLLLQPLQEGRGQGGGGGGRFPPGPHVDHRVGRVVVYVAHGRQHPVEPQQLGLPAGAGPIGPGQGLGPFWIAAPEGIEGEGGHQPAGPFKALAYALLHIGAEQQALLGAGPGPVLQLAATQGQISGAAPQQDYAPQPLGQPAPQLSVAGLPAGVTPLAVAGEATGPQHQQLGQLAPQAHGRSLPSGTGPRSWRSCSRLLSNPKISTPLASPLSC